MDVEDGAQAALVEALEEADVAAVGDPGLGAVEKSGENNVQPYRHGSLFFFSGFCCSTLATV